MLNHLNELLALVYHTAPCEEYPEGITWRAKADEAGSLPPRDRDYSLESQAISWGQVYRCCCRLGMHETPLNYDGSAVGNVLAFINHLHRKATLTEQEKVYAEKWKSLQHIRDSVGAEEMTVTLYDDGSVYVAGPAKSQSFWAIDLDGTLS